MEVEFNSQEGEFFDGAEPSCVYSHGSGDMAKGREALLEWIGEVDAGGGTDSEISQTHGAADPA